SSVVPNAPALMLVFTFSPCGWGFACTSVSFSTGAWAEVEAWGVGACVCDGMADPPGACQQLLRELSWPVRANKGDVRSRFSRVREWPSTRSWSGWTVRRGPDHREHGCRDAIGS